MIYAISILYPKRNGFDGKTPDQLKQISSAWSEVLEDVDFELAMASLKSHAATVEFAPSIAEIRKWVRDLTTGQGITAEEAWELCLSAVRKYGYARKAEAVQTLPESVRSIGERWFDEIGMTESENLGVTRGQFIKAFQIQSERKEREAALPSGIRERLAGIAQKMLMEGV